MFEMVIRIAKPLAGSPKRKEKNQINKIRNEKVEITTDNAEIKKKNKKTL